MNPDPLDVLQLVKTEIRTESKPDFYHRLSAICVYAKFNREAIYGSLVAEVDRLAADFESAYGFDLEFDHETYATILI